MVVVVVVVVSVIVIVSLDPPRKERAHKSNAMALNSLCDSRSKNNDNDAKRANSPFSPFSFSTFLLLVRCTPKVVQSDSKTSNSGS